MMPKPSLPFKGQRLLTVLLVSGLLSVGASSMWSAIALADTPQSSIEQIAQADTALPRSVARRVRRHLARRLNVPMRQIQIINATSASWNDGCLEAPNPDDCAQAVEGWDIELSAGQQTWRYQTDRTGRTVRLAELMLRPPTSSTTLPQSIANAVLQTAARQSGLPSSQLQISAAQSRTWDACLGIYEPGIACAEIAISGWQVTVTDGQQRWVYHTNANGSEIRWNEADSQIGDTGSIAPVPISTLPESVEEGVLFRVIQTGGFAGQYRITTLYENGQVMQEVAPHSEPFFSTVSQQQVDQFRQLLADRRFDRFNALSYPAPAGAADYISVILVSREGATQYADLVQDQLPSDLQQIIQTWQAIADSVR